jgi:hypothetical protein
MIIGKFPPYVVSLCRGGRGFLTGEPGGIYNTIIDILVAAANLPCIGSALRLSVSGNLLMKMTPRWNLRWRGPSRVNVNYLLVEGLSRSGYPDLARQLRQRTLNMIASGDDIYEFYNPVTELTACYFPAD